MADPSIDELLNRIAEERKQRNADPLLVMYSAAACELERQLAANLGEPPQPAPQPEDFGLTAQEADFIKLFTRHDYIPERVEFASIAVFLPVAILTVWYLVGWERWGIALLSGFFLGCSASMLFVYAAKKLRNWRHARVASNSPKYSDYLRYKNACEKHSIYLDALASARRHVETEKEIATQQEVRKEIPKWKGLDGKSFEGDLM